MDSGNENALKIVLLRKIAHLIFIAVLLMSSGYGSHTAAFSNLEMLNYKACFDGVPLREYPNEFAPRAATVPEGTRVRVDIQRGDWLRVIYRLPDGFFIGWSLATMMCPVE